MAKVESFQKSNEMWFFGHFSRRICSTVAETIGVTNYTASSGAKNVQKTTFEAAEMMPGQQHSCRNLRGHTTYPITLLQKSWPDRGITLGKVNGFLIALIFLHLVVFLHF